MIRVKLNMDVDERKFEHKYLWKRRVRTAASAPRSDREIQLYVLWNGERPTKAERADRLLWPVYVLRSGMIFKIVDCDSYNATRHGDYAMSEREALEKYRALVKGFERSKEIDYGFPMLEDQPL